MLNRIFENWKTSILGLIILIACFIFLWFGKTTLSEISIFLLGGFALLFAKDWWIMERIEIFVFSLWAFVLVLVVLNIAYHVYLKITHTYMRFLDMIRFTFGMLILRIQYFFSPKKKTQSPSTTQPFTENLTLYDLSNPVPLAQPTSQKRSCNPPKESPKKRDSKGRYVRS